MLAQGMRVGKVEDPSAWMELVNAVPKDLSLSRKRACLEDIAKSMLACRVHDEGCWAMLYEPAWALAKNMQESLVLRSLVVALMEARLTSTELGQRCLGDLASSAQPIRMISCWSCCWRSHRRWSRARGGFRRGHLQAGCAFLVPGRGLAGGGQGHRPRSLATGAACCCRQAAGRHPAARGIGEDGRGRCRASARLAACARHDRGAAPHEPSDAEALTGEGVIPAPALSESSRRPAARWRPRKSAKPHAGRRWSVSRSGCRSPATSSQTH